MEFTVLTGFVFDRIEKVANVVNFLSVGGPSVIFKVFYKSFPHRK